MLRLCLDSKPWNTQVRRKCQSQYTVKLKLHFPAIGCTRGKKEAKIECQVTDGEREAEYGIYFIMTTFI